MDKIAIVGAGLVGRAWAIVFARAGYPVMLYDSNAETVTKSLETVESSLQDLQEFGLISEAPSARSGAPMQGARRCAEHRARYRQFGTL